MLAIAALRRLVAEDGVLVLGHAERLSHGSMDSGPRDPPRHLHLAARESTPRQSRGRRPMRTRPLARRCRPRRRPRFPHRRPPLRRMPDKTPIFRC